MHIPVLTYHAMHVEGDSHADNDHVALREDLEVLQAGGWRVVPLARIVSALLEPGQGDLPERAVGLSFDDGCWFDWYDLEHPRHGMQRSLANILRDFRDRHGEAAQPQLHATSFVIASAEARDALDRACMIGRGWWTDDWWAAAVAEGLIEIGNHSWDHRHARLPEAQRRGRDYGHFRDLDGEAECELQVEAAQAAIERAAGLRPRLFAYPYGEVPVMLADHYLPTHSQRHGLRAAFTTEPAPVTEGCDRWRLPRYVCGRDWRSGAELQALLVHTLGNYQGSLRK